MNRGSRTHFHSGTHSSSILAVERLWNLCKSQKECLRPALIHPPLRHDRTRF